MRILTVTTFFPNSADRQRAVFVENLVRAMQSLCRLTVISPVPFAPPVRRVSHWYALSQIESKEDVGGIEVLHPRFLVLPKMNWFSGFFYFVGVVPLLWRMKRQHGLCLVHAHFAYPDGVGVALAARLLRLPYVVTVHGSDINSYAASYPVLRSQIRWSLNGARGVIAVSTVLQEKVVELTRWKPVKSACIPCAGFDPDVFSHRLIAECRTSLNLPTNAHVVIYVGHLIPIKGIEFLVDAWALMKQRGVLGEEDLLVIVGHGELRFTLEFQIMELGIASMVQFTGAIPQIDVSRWIGSANVLCLPSHNEGTPNVVVEALASGVPVVATRVGGVPALVCEGVNGLLVSPGKTDELADALAVALAFAWDRDNIRSSVSHLTWDALAKRNCEFLKSVAPTVGEV